MAPPGSAGFSPQSGGGSVGSGAGPSLGSKRSQATRVKKARQHKHSSRALAKVVPPLVSDVNIGPPSGPRE